jgi:hypothetical protein
LNREGFGAPFVIYGEGAGTVPRAGS